VIVRQRPGGIQLITQPDHAALAGSVMEQCVPLATEPRRNKILLAIAEHDSGWRQEDAAPSINPDTGEVVDFVRAPLAVRQAGAPRAMAILADEPWAAALVAQHALTAYARLATDPAWPSFFREITAARDAHLARTEGTLDELVSDYVFVRLGDLISLAFCTGWTDPSVFAGYSVELVGDRVRVAPDVFGGREVALEITALDLPRTTFDSDGELRAALNDATQVTVTGTVCAA
jgi:Protein of unknown function (DUF3891)